MSGSLDMRRLYSRRSKVFGGIAAIGQHGADHIIVIVVSCSIRHHNCSEVIYHGN